MVVVKLGLDNLLSSFGKSFLIFWLCCWKNGINVWFMFGLLIGGLVMISLVNWCNDGELVMYVSDFNSEVCGLKFWGSVWYKLVVVFINFNFNGCCWNLVWVCFMVCVIECKMSFMVFLLSIGDWLFEFLFVGFLVLEVVFGSELVVMCILSRLWRSGFIFLVLRELIYCVCNGRFMWFCSFDFWIWLRNLWIWFMGWRVLINCFMICVVWDKCDVFDCLF